MGTAKKDSTLKMSEIPGPGHYKIKGFAEIAKEQGDKICAMREHARNLNKINNQSKKDFSNNNNNEEVNPIESVENRSGVEGINVNENSQSINSAEKGVVSIE